MFSGEDWIRPYQEENWPVFVIEGDTVKLPFETSKAVDNTQNGNGFTVPGDSGVEIKLKVDID